MSVASGTLESPEVRVADGVYRLGSSLVSWYLVEEGGRVTVVDAGLPGYFPQLDRALSDLGRTRDAVQALVLTHAHFDHVGFAEKLRTEAGVPVYVHEQDAELARTLKLPRTERNMAAYTWRPAALGLVVHGVRMGALSRKPVREVTTFRDGEVLDVPGRPRAVHAPGHTQGCCALHFEGAGVLIAGDVLCERNPLTGRRGPQVLPAAFNISSRQALDSLERLEPIDARVVAFGHGDPWLQGPAAAVVRAHELGRS